MAEFFNATTVATAAIVSAFIGAIAALAGILIRDIVVPLVTYRGKNIRESNDIFELYALPLAQSATSVFWRIGEILGGRSHFLINTDYQSDFYAYKFISSCFRLEVMLAWIRAIDKEIARLPSPGNVGSTDIESAIKRIKWVLAEGEEIERRLVRNIFSIWRVERSFSDSEIKLFGINMGGSSRWFRSNRILISPIVTASILWE